MHTSQRAQAVSHRGLIRTILLIIGIEAARISVLCLMYGCFKETCAAPEENQIFGGGAKLRRGGASETKGQKLTATFEIVFDFLTLNRTMRSATDLGQRADNRSP